MSYKKLIVVDLTDYKEPYHLISVNDAKNRTTNNPARYAMPEVARELYVKKAKEQGQTDKVEHLEKLFTAWENYNNKVLEGNTPKSIPTADSLKGNSKAANKAKTKSVKTTSNIDDTIAVEKLDGEEEMKSEVLVKVVEIKEAGNSNDDLTLIEGVGKKIAEILNNAGIDTYDHLSKYEVASLKAILEDAGKRYKAHDPTTWAEQAQLAADGKWDELKNLQKELKGGKRQ